MKVVHVSSTGNEGGAGKAAYRLHQGLKLQGYNSQMFVVRHPNYDPDVKIFTPPKPVVSTNFSKRLATRFSKQLAHWGSANVSGISLLKSNNRQTESSPDGFDLFSDDRAANPQSFAEQIPEGDVVNLHWIANFLDYEAFFSRNTQLTPIVWTLHDMNSFTGGCHYDNGCGRFNEGCGFCPQLGSHQQVDHSAQTWNRKQNIFDNANVSSLHLVTPSNWLAEEVKKSKLLGKFPTIVIPNGVNCHDFKPRNREVAREVLGIPISGKVVLFVAAKLDKHRKGFVLLMRTLSQLQHIPDLHCVSIGQNKPNIQLPIPHLHLNAFNHDRILSLIYSAADVFVIPSRQDNLPNTVLEAMACGTPVVGFSIGGIPDMVRPGETGFLALKDDVTGLGKAIENLLRDPDMAERMRTQCRQVVLSEYTIEQQAQAYIQLYQNILKRSSSS